MRSNSNVKLQLEGLLKFPIPERIKPQFQHGSKTGSELFKIERKKFLYNVPKSKSKISSITINNALLPPSNSVLTNADIKCLNNECNAPKNCCTESLHDNYLIKQFNPKSLTNIIRSYYINKGQRKFYSKELKEECKNPMRILKLNTSTRLNQIKDKKIYKDILLKCIDEKLPTRNNKPNLIDKKGKNLIQSFTVSNDIIKTNRDGISNPSKFDLI